MTLPTLLRSSLFVALLLGSAQAFAEATHYPLTIQSCNREVIFEQAPRHALSHDINMTQMMLALGLKPRMVGYSGISGWKAVTPPMQSILDDLPELAAKYPSVHRRWGSLPAGRAGRAPRAPGRCFRARR